ncbi:MAG TPA: hypothetical protein VK530_03265 [Candidatus Acidoferrum sp.]|nr:hypothetical protein [Candidatus Acidoferrum sp.]
MIYSPWLRARALLLVASVGFCQCAIAGDLTPLVSTLMRDEEDLAHVRFADVVHGATGKKILPLTTNAADALFAQKIGRGLDAVLAKLNAKDSAAHQKRRINEVSGVFEEAIKTELNRIEGFTCDFTRTASGTYQRSGYPDLKLTDKASGRVAYLDPKLFDRGSRASSFRTFYFEPKRNTNKILEDAHHLIIGVEHVGKVDGAWRFTNWELIDLTQFHVKLKAEFQASNRELYRPEAIVASSTNTTKAQKP